MFNLATYQISLEVVYPVGVTEVRLCFMCKIAYNSLNVDQINPKSDTGIRLYTLNMCTKFQPDWSTILQSMQKEEKKLKKFCKIITREQLKY